MTEREELEIERIEVEREKGDVESVYSEIGKKEMG